MNVKSPKLEINIEYNKNIYKNKEKSVQENLPPSLLEFTKNMDKAFVFEQKESSLNKKNEEEKIPLYNINNSLTDVKEKIDNRNLIISKIESNDIFKKVKNNEKHSKSKSLSSPDILTDLKKSLERYNLIISQQGKNGDLKKRYTIEQDSSFINTKEEKIIKSLSLIKSKSEISLASDNIENDNRIKEYINKPSPLVKSKSEILNIDNIKSENKIKEYIRKPLPLVKSKSEILSDLDNIKNKDDIKKEDILKISPFVIKKNELFFKTLNEIKIHEEKKDEIKKHSNTSSLFDTLVSPSNKKKYEMSNIMNTPIKKETIPIFRTPNKIITPKKAVSEHFKTIWDSSTKNLHSTLSLKKSSIVNNAENIKNNIDINYNKFNFSSSSIKRCSSPERESNLSYFSKGSKSTDFKREMLKDRYMKGSSSIPAKNKMKYFFGTDYENLRINFNDNKIKSNIFEKIYDNFDKKCEIESTNISVQNPINSPLANKSKEFLMGSIENINNTKENQIFKLKKSMSDLTDLINNFEKKTENDKQKKTSWNTTHDINYQDELTSAVSQSSKLEQTEIIKTKSKIATLTAAKLIQRQKERQNLDKKQKVKINFERHKLYLQKKKKEEEEERQRELLINNTKVEKQQEIKQEKEKKRIESEKMLQQMKLDMELLIRKRNEKIKQVQERKQALKQRELTKKSILLNSPYLLRTSYVNVNNLSSTSPNIPKPSTFNQYKTSKDSIKTKDLSSSINNFTSKNSNGKRPSLELDNSRNPKKALFTSNVSINIPKSSSLKFKSSKTNSNIPIKICSVNTIIKTNTSSKSIPLEPITKPNYEPVLNDLTQLLPQDEIIKEVNDSKNSISSISSSRSSNTCKETILQDGEIPDIPSE